MEKKKKICFLKNFWFLILFKVIIRKDNTIKLYCKGADSVIFERLNPVSEDVKEETIDHLSRFASEGLRTLCLAKRVLDEEVFVNWRSRLQEAATSLENREDKINNLYEEIEQDLILVGATAIEDKLQEGVPQTIANLSAANIKIWVLTGDKQETAINIGYACQLLTDDMIDVFTIESWEYDKVEQDLLQFRETIRNIDIHNKVNENCPTIKFISNNESHFAINAVNNVKFPTCDFGGPSTIENDFALVINGHSLVHALNPSLELLFLEVATKCRSVVCCRVTPLQKALVVDLVKRHKKAITLAIGDGANDVSMIKSTFEFELKIGPSFILFYF